MLLLGSVAAGFASSFSDTISHGHLFLGSENPEAMLANAAMASAAAADPELVLAGSALVVLAGASVDAGKAASAASLAEAEAAVGGAPGWEERNNKAAQRLKALAVQLGPQDSCTLKAVWYPVQILDSLVRVCGAGDSEELSHLKRLNHTASHAYSLQERPPVHFGKHKPYHVAVVLDCRSSDHRGAMVSVELFNSGFVVRSSLQHGSLRALLDSAAPHQVFSAGADVELGWSQSAAALAKLYELVALLSDEEYHLFNFNCQVFADRLYADLSGTHLNDVLKRRWTDCHGGTPQATFKGWYRNCFEPQLF